MQDIFCDDKINNLLRDSKNIAVVGLSDKPDRDSYRVALYMQQHGYRIFPVNPRLKNVMGTAAYSSLLDIPEKIDIVNIFRRSDQVLPIVEEAIKISPRAIWLQLGIINEEAAKICREAGIHIIMDKCIKVEHARLV